ncbi:MAG: energy-coupling factor transporter transmembrane protein EcfT [Actinobacteria bacterium]|nr:energy-coupling factor transporter transmembrane protein EcfT [Actinomycetota bacterium]
MTDKTIPKWLLKNENYILQPDKDTFIDKSIISLLGILSHIHRQSSYKTDFFGINAAFSVIFTILFIVLISVSRSLGFVITAIVYLLLVLCLLKAEDIISILKISFGVAVFTFIILLPTALYGNYYSITMITPKVFAVVTAINILSHSTRWNSITSAFKMFLIPDIFILILDITILYITILGEFSLNMLYALKLRSVGKNKSKRTHISGIAGTIFVKSREMAEETYEAMECRGFTGEYHRHKKFKFSLADAVYIIANAVIILSFVYFKGYLQR